MTRLVVTADDFGLAPEVNEAVERAHRHGILSAASLMVAGPAAAQAVKLARTMPSLRVGVHLVLVEGVPASRRQDIPDLIDRKGMLRADMVRLACDIALRPRVRRQMRREIAAQFELFRKTGLPLDHVNAHKHFHVHPLIAGDVLRIGREYGMRALRVPHEPGGIVARVDSAATASAYNRSAQGIMSPWTALLRGRARRAGLTTPDAVFGLRFTGVMTAGRLRGLLGHLPDGLVEIYTHPATSNTFAGHASGYRYADELQALTGPEVITALRHSGRRLGGYADAMPNAATRLGAADSLAARTTGSRP